MLTMPPLVFLPSYCNPHQDWGLFLPSDIQLCVILQQLLGQGGVDRMNYSRLVKKVLKLLRKMSYWERMDVHDWLNDWYSWEKEREQE